MSSAWSGVGGGSGGAAQGGRPGPRRAAARATGAAAGAAQGGRGAAGGGPSDRFDVRGVTREGASWLASAETYPHSALTHWARRPDAPLVLPCGRVFDVVNAPAFFGRRMLDPLWKEGPGSGPVAVHRGRMLLFAAPGTAQRLPSLLGWEEWNTGRDWAAPVLCHGRGDAITVPALTPGPRDAVRWLVAPDTRHPWLPGPDTLLWACVRAARTAPRISIFPRADQGANVYDVSRRR
ncbi:bifunctional DNA primase/polymerase [Streptomyces sp. NPDC050560]|uniref:bifunctional DNA primase/polymerase n=1 Tax=Streptomyces sp. NPDC050560 TaxID=3365630 RepID=UPI0037936ED0